MQVLYLGRALRTKETLPDFLKWRRVTRHPLVFHGLTGSQRTPGIGASQVKLHRPGELEVKFRGLRRELSSNMISTMAALKMLHKGCQGYLAYVVETGKEGTMVDEIPVVREFPDVFPDDIARLPPKREVEFTIDLIPETKPISNPPYRMAPAELRELKAQLE